MNAERSAPHPILMFGDYVCPFSYLSLRALERVAEELTLAIEWRSLELRPAPWPAGEPPSASEWAVVQELARSASMPLVRPGRQPRTRKAHEATKFAATLGMTGALRQAIFDAHFAAGRDIGRIDVLVQIAEPLGIDPAALKVALDVDSFADEVAADLLLAQQLEIEGTPAFMAGADVRVGYLSYEHLRDWLKD